MFYRQRFCFVFLFFYQIIVQNLNTPPPPPALSLLNTDFLLVGVSDVC